MVRTLNTILLTTSELFELRMHLKDITNAVIQSTHIALACQGILNCCFLSSEVGIVISVPVYVLGALSSLHAIPLPISSMLSTCIGAGCAIVCFLAIYLTLVYSNFDFFFNSGDIEVTVEFLIEMDKLVQLIESPIFACKLIKTRNI